MLFHSKKQVITPEIVMKMIELLEQGEVITIQYGDPNKHQKIIFQITNSHKLEEPKESVIMWVGTEPPNKKWLEQVKELLKAAIGEVDPLPPHIIPPLPLYH